MSMEQEIAELQEGFDGLRGEIAELQDEVVSLRGEIGCAREAIRHEVRAIFEESFYAMREGVREALDVQGALTRSLKRRIDP